VWQLSGTWPRLPANVQVTSLTYTLCCASTAMPCGAAKLPAATGSGPPQRPLPAHAHTVLRVAAGAGRRREVSGRDRVRAAPAADHGAVLVVDADTPRFDVTRRAVPSRRLTRLPPEPRYVCATLAVEDDVRRAPGVGPLREVLAVRAENLDAIVLAIAHEDAAVGGHRDAVGQEELAGALARHTPRPLQLAAGREEVHAAVAVAVRDVEIAPRADRKVRRPVEGPTGPLDGRGVLAVVASV